MNNSISPLTLRFSQPNHGTVVADFGRQNAYQREGERGQANSFCLNNSLSGMCGDFGGLSDQLKPKQARLVVKGSKSENIKNLSPVTGECNMHGSY